MIQQQDWRTLEAGDVLDRFIAELLGYRLEQRGNQWFIVEPDLPDGRYFGELECKPALDDAWASALYSEYGGSVVPWFSRDMNAALALIPPGFAFTIDNWTFDDELHMIAGQWNAMLEDPTTYRKTEWIASADTPALAICRAYLAYKESRYGRP